MCCGATPTRFPRAHVRAFPRQNVELVVLCTAFLKRLSVWAENKDRMVEFGVPAKLAAFVPVNHEVLLMAALRLLLNLSFDAAARAQMLDAGLLPKVRLTRRRVPQRCRVSDARAACRRAQFVEMLNDATYGTARARARPRAGAARGRPDGHPHCAADGNGPGVPPERRRRGEGGAGADARRAHAVRHAHAGARAPPLRGGVAAARLTRWRIAMRDARGRRRTCTR